ncbi:MAG TPA: translocation/assembly module TamB domain-containing protein, partial [Longimicrobiales bacterium]|nr:translocation/assembly module TamB domain-containing protein [Longimicrobiales bacterium]
TELAPNAIRPSRDVVFADDSLASARQLMRIIPRVRVTLGDSISVQGFGFTARPRGTLLLSEGPGATLVGTGEVTVTGGRYRAYGQDLTIERGRILFASSPLDDPGLDVRASRTAGDGVVAGLDVSGTLGQPEVAVFSEPAMPQSDALAYIVLGRPLGAASTAEGNRVASAAASLGLRRGDVLAGRIAQRFGLSDARIEADGPLDQAALVAGKYLSPRLYVSYGVGLIEPVSTFRMRYLLSGRWTLTAESGSSAGADLQYRIERGRQR